MIERRVDHARRKRVSEMSPEEMRQALLVSEKTGLPNRRAFDERESSHWVAMCDVNGLKALNDGFGYSAGDTLIRRLAEVLIGADVDAYHDKGDEFLCRGDSYPELNQKLTHARRLLQEQPFAVCGIDGRITSVPGADFCFGIGTILEEAERSLKHKKELRKTTKLVSRLTAQNSLHLDVFLEDDLQGHLYIAQGSVQWWPGKASRYAHHSDWPTFIELLKTMKKRRFHRP